MERNELIQKVEVAIADWDKEGLTLMVCEALGDGLKPLEVTSEILLPILQRACRDMDSHNITFPELLLQADTIKSALDLLIPKIKQSMRGTKARARIVIGTVEGDIHDLGKNLVAAVFESGGYHVLDLGRNVSVTAFVEAAHKEKADVIAVSTLLTPTLMNMETLVKEVRGRRLKAKTIIGGWATSPEFALKIKADAWAPDALEGLFVLDRLMQRPSRD